MLVGRGATQLQRGPCGGMLVPACGCGQRSRGCCAAHPLWLAGTSSGMAALLLHWPVGSLAEQMRANTAASTISTTMTFRNS